MQFDNFCTSQHAINFQFVYIFKLLCYKFNLIQDSITEIQRSMDQKHFFGVISLQPSKTNKALDFYGIHRYKGMIHYLHGPLFCGNCLCIFS